MQPPFSQSHTHLPQPRSTVKAKVARFLGRNWARVGYARHVEPTWLALNRIPIGIRGLSPAFSGVRVAHLTDFHFGNHIPKGYIEDALDRTMAEKPDVIALTGDFIDRGTHHIHAAAKLFRRLNAPLGVFAVLGNHDFSVHTVRGVQRHPGIDRVVAAALAQEGVTVLRNRAVRLERNGEALVVAGVDDLWSGVSNPHAALSGECPLTPRLVLAHNPQSLESFGQQRADLILSGHTHGGQIDLPGMGRVLLGKKAKRWAAGLYSYEGGHIYVNTGVGFGWRFRFGVRPEVAVFTLQPASESDSL